MVCTHGDHLALGSTDPPQQKAVTTTIRPREVVGPPMEVMARPTLTPRDHTLNYTENELPTSFSRASSWNHLQLSSLWLARRKQRPGNIGSVVVVRLLAIFEGSVRLCCRVSCGLCAVCGSSDVISWRGCADIGRAELLLFAFDLLFDFQRSTFLFSQSVVDRVFFRNPKNEGEHVWTRHKSAPCFFHFDFRFRFCLDMPWGRLLCNIFFGDNTRSVYLSGGFGVSRPKYDQMLSQLHLMGPVWWKICSSLISPNTKTEQIVFFCLLFQPVLKVI